MYLREELVLELVLVGNGGLQLAHQLRVLWGGDVRMSACQQPPHPPIFTHITPIKTHLVLVRLVERLRLPQRRAGRLLLRRRGPEGGRQRVARVGLRRQLRCLEQRLPAVLLSWPRW